LHAAQETVDARAPPDGLRFAWSVMRAATAGDNCYMHQWRAGDTICWDQRRMLHARVAYDGDREERLMWRVGWGSDLPGNTTPLSVSRGSRL
jgi:alpha-ketoglutarate-dependent taurine dioxygenase